MKRNNPRILSRAHNFLYDFTEQVCSYGKALAGIWSKPRLGLWSPDKLFSDLSNFLQEKADVVL
jgi:hypothetical protein